MTSTAFDNAMARILPAAGDPGLIVAALSGGLDSIVLLHLLHRWRRTGGRAVDIVAAHLNHGLRDADADADAAWCRAFADALGVGFALAAADVAAFARDNRLGVEAAGRLLRYRFFRRVAADRPFVVLTGHHADDQAETILMHLHRGAHRRGLSGMREFSIVPLEADAAVPIGRPLLAIPRAELRRYALGNGLAWREDASNRDPAYFRNRVRLRVLPWLEKAFPGFRDRLLARAAVWAAEEAEWNEAGRRTADALLAREAGGVFFQYPAASVDPEAALYALRQMIEEELGGLLPSGRALRRLMRMDCGLTLPGGLAVRREQDGLFFFRPGYDGDGGEETILPDPPFDVAAGVLRISAELLPCSGPLPEADRRDPNVEWLDAASLAWPLTLRPTRPGERFRPIGAPGSRKMQDIMVDAKLPRRKRGLARVVADGEGAAWLWPLRLAERVKLTAETTTALRLTIREELGT